MQTHQPKHIVYVIARFLPFFGGAEQNCYQLAKRAAANGYQVTILTTDLHPTNQKLAASENIDGIQVVRLHAWNRQLNLGFYPRLLTQLWQMDADIIHVCNGAGFLWRDICLFFRKLKSPHTPIIVTPHGPFLATPFTHSGLKFYLAKVARILMQPYLKYVWKRLFAAVIAVNPNQKSWLTSQMGFNHPQIHLVPNGIEPVYVLSTLPQKPSAQINLTYLGRLEKYKGVHKIIAALAKLGPDANLHLTIMGSGVYEQHLRKLVSVHNLEGIVDFHINPTNEIRDNILTHSDLTVLMSDWEATGIVLLEAMAKANIIVTSSQNEAAESIVSEGENGYILDKNDVAGLADVLKKLTNQSRVEITQMQKASLRMAQQFNWDHIYQSYNNLLQKLIK